MNNPWVRMRPYTKNEIKGKRPITPRQYNDLYSRVIVATEEYFAERGIDLIWDDAVRLGGETSSDIREYALTLWADAGEISYKVIQRWLADNGYENGEAYQSRLA